MKTFEKDPNAILDYQWDWSEWLGSDTIDTDPDKTLVQILSGSIVIGDILIADGKVTAWLSGGTVDEPTVVVCRITTAEGRVDERSASFLIKER